MNREHNSISIFIINNKQQQFIFVNLNTSSLRKLRFKNILNFNCLAFPIKHQLVSDFKCISIQVLEINLCKVEYINILKTDLN